VADEHSTGDEQASTQAATDSGAAVPPRPRRRGRRLLTIVVVTLALAYVGICVGVYLGQTQLLYFPSRSYGLRPKDAALPYEDLKLPTPAGTTIAAWYIPLPVGTPKGSVIFCQGNAGNMSEQVGSAKSFSRLGYNVLLFDYEGYGGSTGEPNEAGTYRAAEAAWNYLTQTRGERPERIVVFGRSLGGGVAIELAHRHTPGALLVECTFTSIVDMGAHQYPYLPVGLICKNRYESVNKVGQIPCPKLFLHGSGDELIPPEMGRRLFAAAAEPKEFLETPGGHNDAGFEHDWGTTQRVGAWLDAALRRQK